VKQDPLDRPTKILAVIVLYLCKVEDCQSLRSIKEAADRCCSVQVKILIVDNSPGHGTSSSPINGLVYMRLASNEGIAGAYNRALTMASNEDFDWLITLDQDTTLPGDFLERMGALADKFQEDETVAAIVPQLVAGGHPLSPIYIGLLRNKPVPKGFIGFNRRELYALNSAALLRVSSIEKIGGFSSDFWLDQLDLWLHHQLHHAAKRVYVNGDVQVEHRLSLQEYGSMSSVRYENFLEAESAFFDIYKSPLENLAFTLVMGFRYCRYIFRGERPEIVALTMQALKMRILKSRNARLSQWKSACERRRGYGDDHDRRILPRPRISVCIAAHNGARFIQSQVRSILDQLGASDEVIVVDDCSSDETCQILEGFGDSRILLHRQELNRGVLRSFEAAIARATGEIIFLSDQDDIWMPDKVRCVVDAFQDNPKADIVVSDAELIGTNNARFEKTYYQERGRFQSGVLSNIFRCKYLGCTMAFRSSVSTNLLPFPKRSDILHDVWIGTAASLAGYRVFYIDRPLMQYRRHENNATGNRSLTLTRQLRIRWDLCRSLAVFCWRFYRSPSNRMSS
jgi:glycosyltransferase involved in cell wall biosynthesis